MQIVAFATSISRNDDRPMFTTEEFLLISHLQ